MRKTRIILLLLIMLTFILIVSPICQNSFDDVQHGELSSREILVINLTGPVDPGTYSMMKSDLSGLSNSSVAAVIININSDSGMLNSALTIDKYINSTENSGINVYAYIGSDASATHAAAYIAMDTDDVYMASATFIGAAKPYIIGASGPMETADINDMSSVMYNIASSHGRNGTYAGEMVSGNINYNSAIAITDNVANGHSSSLSGLISKLNLSSSSIHYKNEGLYDDLIGFFGSPFTAGLLILVGIIAIFFDLYHGTIVLSVIGVAMIILGLIGAALIDASVLGLILLFIAGVLIFIEFKTNHGVAMLLGLIAGIAGVYYLGSSYGNSNPGYSPNPYGEGFELTSIAILLIGILMIIYISRILKSQVHDHYTGIESLIGHNAEVKTDMGSNRKGFVAVEGVQWRALNIGVPVTKKDRVVIIERRGLMLIVKKI